MSSTSANTPMVHPTLYVPLHKRSRSEVSSISSRSTTPTDEHESISDSFVLPIYSIQDLLHLSKSPLVVFSTEKRDHLNETLPQITLSQRKAIEHHVKKARGHAPAGETHSEPKAKEETPQPLSPISTTVFPQRRSALRGRAPERRRNLKKVVDELNWRAARTRSMASSPLLLFPTVA